MQNTSPIPVRLDGVNKTLLLPLWARAKESTQKNPLIIDWSWFEDIGSPALGLLFVACGVLQYFTGKQVKQLLSAMATRFPGSEIVFDTMSKFFLLAGNWAVIKNSGMGCKSFMKWGATSAKEVARRDKRFTVVDEYPLFSRIQLDASWDKDIIDRMKQANRMRGLNIFHLRFTPSVSWTPVRA
jgi:O-methyltransferase involved in polyketide biosynthesis